MQTGTWLPITPLLLRNTAGLARGINTGHEINSGECLPHNPEETTDLPDALAYLKTPQYADHVCRSGVPKKKFPFRLPELGHAFQGD